MGTVKKFILSNLGQLWLEILLTKRVDIAGYGIQRITCKQSQLFLKYGELTNTNISINMSKELAINKNAVAHICPYFDGGLIKPPL